jgi:hypothetical protein
VVPNHEVAGSRPAGCSKSKWPPWISKKAKKALIELNKAIKQFEKENGPITADNPVCRKIDEDYASVA